ncbi:MAG: helix-turn-helix domain-containing protein [Candidatus Electrothrix sp. AR5]|nr:helix-turn-helix domain-containing protein [Candidatus Electrothrix sp. AR5]
MNKKYIVYLQENERRSLENIVNRGQSAAYKIKNANILLKVDQNSYGWTDEKTAEAFSVHKSTVAVVRRRFVEQGLDGVLGRKVKVYGRRVWEEEPAASL